MKAMGCPSCIRTAPIPALDASVSTTNSLLKSGKAKTGALVIKLFKRVNACAASSFHPMAPFFNREVSGLEMLL
jgi:hypothetical protein